MQKDFSLPLKIDDLSQNEQHYHIRANDAQKKELAAILKVESVPAFEANIFLKYHHKKHRLDVRGNVSATLELESVISLEHFLKDYNTDFSYYYDTEMNYHELKNLGAGIEDDVPEIMENRQIDLGQIAIEQLALIMDDYPRKDGEVFVFQSEFDEETTKKANPFAVLQKLKK